MTMIDRGRYVARAVEGALGYTSTGKEQAAVLFRIEEGDWAGHEITWYGYFTDKTADRTLESLMNAGWDGKDIGKLEGLGSKQVSIVIDHEPDQDGVERARVRWVNELGAGGVALKKRMDEGDKASFAERMKGRALAMAQQRGVAPAAETDDLPF